jgi:hypothetical protein
MVGLVLDKFDSCLRPWPCLRFCFVRHYFIILSGRSRGLALLYFIAASAFGRM